MLATRFAPLEVNNGGSQGHWICSSVNHALLAAYGLEGKRIFDRPDALIDDVYEAFVDWLVDRMTPKRFSHAFPEGQVPLAFLSGHYSGRMVNDIEGPRIAAHVSRRYGVEADYFVGFAQLELGRRVRVRDREMALVKRRGAGDEHSFAVWSDLYVTDSMEHVAACVDVDDPLTRELARAFLEGRVLGISAWPGRELCENDKAHVVDKANAHALRATLGLSAADAAVLQQAAPGAFSIGGDAATVAKLCDERDRWVVKARFGCGGSSVIVGAKPSWPTQSLPRVESLDGGKHATRVTIADLARDADVALELDQEGRIAAASWAALWPHLVRFAASSPGHYVAQVRVEPAPFQAMVFDGRRIDAFEATTDFAAAFTLGWRGDGLRLATSGTLCRAVRSATRTPTSRRAGRWCRSCARTSSTACTSRWGSTASAPPRPRRPRRAPRGCPRLTRASYDGTAMPRPAVPWVSIRRAALAACAAALVTAAAALAAAVDGPGSPGRAYLDLRAAVDKASSPKAIMAYLSGNYRRVVSNLPKAEREAWLARMKRVPAAAGEDPGAGAGRRPRRARRRRARRGPRQVVGPGRDGARRRRLEARRRDLDDRDAVSAGGPSHDVARWLYRIDAYTWTAPFRQESDYAFFDAKGRLRLLIERNGAITVTRGYTWNGCSPKFFVLDLLFGTPEGVVDARTAQRKTYYASMVHDALYQFLADGLPLTRVQADRCFLSLMGE